MLTHQVNENINCFSSRSFHRFYMTLSEKFLMVPVLPVVKEASQVSDLVLWISRLLTSQLFGSSAELLSFLRQHDMVTTNTNSGVKASVQQCLADSPIGGPLSHPDFNPPQLGSLDMSGEFAMELPPPLTSSSAHMDVDEQNAIGSMGMFTPIDFSTSGLGDNGYDMDEEEDGTGSLSRNSKKPTVTTSDFTLLKVIGVGSYGKVMLVKKKDNNNIYAMKVLEKQNIINRNQVDHTNTERSILEVVTHPFIVTLRYAFQTKQKLFFVLDYFPGGELFFHLGKFGRFPEHLVKFYAAQMMDALDYLHSKNIVYRDLKPENVLLGADGYIALTDFGLSKENIQDHSSATSFCGTPEYLAPEVLTRSGHGRAADWWSLGSLIYEMLSGMPPFYSQDRQKLFKKILNDRLRVPRFFSNEVTSLIAGLLHRDPAQRLGSTGGGEEIRQHPFFQDVDFESLRRKEVKAPFIPRVDGLVDTSNFDAEFTTQKCVSIDPRPNPFGIPAFSVSDGKFAGFTYVRPDSNPGFRLNGN